MALVRCTRGTVFCCRFASCPKKPPAWRLLREGNDLRYASGWKYRAKVGYAKQGSAAARLSFSVVLHNRVLLQTKTPNGWRSLEIPLEKHGGECH